ECPAPDECRLVTPSTCSSPPCLPEPQCVLNSIRPTQFDSTCSSWDESTVDSPVLNGTCVASGADSETCELDCRSQVCPERTVCVRMGRVQSRCCWQSTQALLLPRPKPGECPPDILLEAVSSTPGSYLRPHQRCQLDAQCPGQQKCCSFNRPGRSRSTNSGILGGEPEVVEKTFSVSGVCIDPSHKLLGELFPTSSMPDV
ncbi:hypothetical protein EGW08_019040, partial [Elysia chlorotica]